MEYRALTKGTKESLELKGPFLDLGILKDKLIKL
jgi:hypothetical protein